MEKTFEEFLSENEKLCERAKSDAVSINENFKARDDAGLIALPIALKIIREMTTSLRDAMECWDDPERDFAEGLLKKAEQIINEADHA